MKSREGQPPKKPRKQQCCDTCAKELGEARLVVHSLDPAVPSGVFCVDRRCFMRACGVEAGQDAP